ncbi:MAG TPA: hypothetical protein VLB68_31040, partial [Pyrinomonadaceae bacterium]|nr:hypothetical protein [Pyrinomonadaceae bacterium]
MRIKIFCMTLMMGLLVFGTSAVVVAQQELVVDIPFNFTVCREQLPAGKYKVRPISAANPHIVLVQSKDAGFVDLACT